MAQQCVSLLSFPVLSRVSWPKKRSGRNATRVKRGRLKLNFLSCKKAGKKGGREIDALTSKRGETGRKQKM